MDPERFEDIIQDQFGVREQAVQSSESAFPLLDPDGKVAALGVELQLDVLHGTVSSTHLGERLQDMEEQPSEETIKLLATHRLEAFTAFYQQVGQLLYDPGEEPEPGILYVGDIAFVREHPGDFASSEKLLEWATHLACRQTYEALEEADRMPESIRLNLGNLINTIYISYSFDSTNFQELLEH